MHNPFRPSVLQSVVAAAIGLIVLGAMFMLFMSGVRLQANPVPALASRLAAAQVALYVRTDGMLFATPLLRHHLASELPDLTALSGSIVYELAILHGTGNVRAGEWVLQTIGTNAQNSSLRTSNASSSEALLTAAQARDIQTFADTAGFRRFMSKRGTETAALLPASGCPAPRAPMSCCESCFLRTDTSRSP